jgi:integrase-like protein
VGSVKADYGTVDNGMEFASKAMDQWAYWNGVHLDFIRPGRPVENGYIESFNGRLRYECACEGDGRKNAAAGPDEHCGKEDQHLSG